MVSAGAAVSIERRTAETVRTVQRQYEKMMKSLRAATANPLSGAPFPSPPFPG